MAGDAPTTNALKNIAKAIEDQNRILKDLSKTMERSTKILEAMNDNYVAVNRRDDLANQNERRLQ